MPSVVRSSLLVASVFVAALAACGGGSTEGGAPNTPSPAPSGSTMAPPSSSSDAGPSGEAPGPTPVTENGEMPAITATTMAADLTALGLDPKNLPPLDKLDAEKLRKVMKTFSKALGVPCTKCHDANNFEAPTKNKRIASMMWDLYVRGFAMADGSPVYCDTCHGGKKEFLDRHDQKALGHWMHENFVDKLKRTDGKTNSCETCHGKPFQPEFLAAIGRGTAK